MSEKSTADDSAAEEAQQDITDALGDILEHRVVIEQAKGMLMLIYKTTPDKAFDVLRWRSQETNTKLRDLAERLVKEFTTIGIRGRSRTEYDEALMTLHERI
ncbi:ANTAR domain-containing protein [Micrococcus luteus]|uniref:ANTAR domain-containing protein n=1 Tax=Micrococcus luteus TaxID=1270 RepID=UPI00342CDA47